MKILGIGSATKIISIGLVDEEKVYCSTTLSELQSEKIIFYIKEAGISPSQLEGVAVAIGPGSYSGLRGGVTVAKTLSQALDIPLVGISTLEAIAYNLLEVSGVIGVVLDAKADEYNFALFGAAKGRMERLTRDLVLPYSKLASILSSVAGEITMIGRTDELKKELKGENITFGDAKVAYPYGVNLAYLGLQKIKSGKVDDPLTLSPHYSHKPNFKEFENQKFE